MRKTCRWCGRTHPVGYECPARPRRSWAGFKRRDDGQADIRRSTRWKKMSLAIRERDNFLCQVCARNLYMDGTDGRTLNHEGAQVHHIVPLATDRTQAFEPANLLTLCTLHHEMAERGEIPAGVLLRIAREQEEAGGEGLDGGHPP